MAKTQLAPSVLIHAEPPAIKVLYVAIIFNKTTMRAKRARVHITNFAS
jgi:hypothetical protein